MAKFTPKMQKFCEEYLVDLNGTQAAIRAGYSKKVANQQAYELLLRDDIKEKIREIREELMITTGITAKQVIEELSRMALWSIKDFIGGQNSVNDLSLMDRVKLIPVVGIKVRERFEKNIVDEGEPIRIVETELKFVDKRASLIDLGRHLGIFKEDNEQLRAKITVTRK
jgi:phage terminase small subunit